MHNFGTTCFWESGGKLELSKCGFHIIFYNFNDNGTPKMRDIGDLIITLKNEKNEDKSEPRR